MGSPAMAQFHYYQFTDADGSWVSCDSPESVRQYLRDNKSWASRTYVVLVTPGFLPTPAVPGVRWGVAIKKPDGSVELVPDQV